MGGGGSSLHDVTEKEMRKLSENRGKAGKISVHMDEGFGFTRLETRTLEEIAKVDLDNLPLRKQLRLRLQSAIFLSTHPRNQTFSVWPGGGRAVVTERDRGRPSGRGTDEVSGSRPLRGSRCNQCSLLTAFSRKTVTMMKTGFQEKLVIKKCSPKAVTQIRTA